jgi:endonuclease/exonuclease/phosphatase family metal-dependent hydrolase
MHINLATINMWGLPLNTTKHARFKALAAALLTLNPDMVLVQEVWDRADYETLVTDSGYQHYTPYGKFKYVGACAGLVTLSRYPILSINKIGYCWRYGLPNLVKAALHTRVWVHGEVVDVFNTHLSANLEVSLGEESNIFGKIMFTSDAEEQTRWKQLQILTPHLRGLVPTVLGGDLNTGPRYPLWYKWHHWCQEHYPDWWSTASYVEGLPSTYCNNLAGQDQGQLDHIMGFSGAKIVNTKIILQDKEWMCIRGNYKLMHISDHYGLMSTIEIPCK